MSLNKIEIQRVKEILLYNNSSNSYNFKQTITPVVKIQIFYLKRY